MHVIVFWSGGAAEVDGLCFATSSRSGPADVKPHADVARLDVGVDDAHRGTARFADGRAKCVAKVRGETTFAREHAGAVTAIVNATGASCAGSERATRPVA